MRGEHRAALERLQAHVRGAIDDIIAMGEPDDNAEIRKLSIALRVLLDAVERVTYTGGVARRRVFIGRHGDSDVTDDLLGPIGQAKDALADVEPL